MEAFPTSTGPAVSAGPGIVYAANSEPRQTLLRRLVWISALLALELGLISHFVSEAGIGGIRFSRGVVAFTATFCAFGLFRAKRAFRQLAQEAAPYQLNWLLLCAHFTALGTLLISFRLLLSKDLLYRGRPALIGITYCIGAVVVSAALFAAAPARFWARLARRTGAVCAYAAGAAIAATYLTSFSVQLWDLASYVTLVLVRLILGLVFTQVYFDPDHRLVGTANFSVSIAHTCSGVEGIGLMLAFSVAWLWFFRRECRFPQALLLVPAALISIYVLNAVRIAALILIGHLGAPHVAAGGFHSEAGWMAFNVVALGFSLAAKRISWVQASRPPDTHHERIADNPVAAYLMPLVSILAASMLSQALASGLEWAYALRVICGAVALLMFRRHYQTLNWRFGWTAPLAGAVCFAMWIVLDSVAGSKYSSGIGAGLAAMPAAARVAWITFRVLGAVVTVPIAEELAFRGYVLRRLVAANFETVDPRRFTWISLFVSSLLFGLMHGDRWIAGTLAGLLYAGVLLRRGRIGDAVVAHATTNLLLAAWVLTRGAWYLW